MYSLTHSYVHEQQARFSLAGKAFFGSEKMTRWMRRQPKSILAIKPQNYFHQEKRGHRFIFTELNFHVLMKAVQCSLRRNPYGLQLKYTAKAICGP